LIIALLSLGDFAVPDFFGIRTAGSEIFAIAASYLDARAALYASLPLILGTMLLLLFLAYNSRRTWRALALAGAARGRQEPRDGRAAKYLAAFLAASAIGILGVPLTAVLSTLANGTATWTAVLGQTIASVDGDIIDSVRLASLVAMFAAILSLLGAYASSRAENKLDHLGRGVAALALVTPIGLWALGASILSANLPFSVAGSVGVALAIGVGLRTLTPSMEIFAGVLRGVPVSYEEAGRAAGLSNGTIWARVLAPQLIESMFVAFFVAWVWALNDVTVTVLLAPPGFSTLMLRIFQSVHYGPPEYLAALVVIHITMILAALVVALAGSRLLRRIWR
jgi:iron(III) transport system permease protein